MYCSHSHCSSDPALKDRLPQSGTMTGHKMETAFECSKDIQQKFKNADGHLIGKSVYAVNRNILYIQSLCSLLDGLESYSSWVYRHSIDVALISMILADKLGYDEYTMQELCIGALLHDIGKLLIPKEILQKPGKLDTGEMKTMQQHSVLGYNLIINLDIQKCSKAIVLQHHERLDGSGYPFGLSNESICDTAKIVMVADALDAMTTCRPYRSTLTVNDAIANIQIDRAKYSEDILSILELLAY